MFLAGDEFGNTKFGNNNSYCQDNEISWLDWSFLEKNRDLFEFFKFMISYRKRHQVISKRLPDAVCGMEPLHTHDADASKTVDLPEDMRTLAVSFAGYDREKGKDDMVYVVINTNWEEVCVTLPDLKRRGEWYLSVDTYGDGGGRFFYPEGEEIRIEHEYLMRPRTVAVFTGHIF